MQQAVRLRTGLRTLALPLALGLALPVGAQVFRVSSSLDQPDVQPGDGLCLDAAAECTLRAAIQEANALPGAQGIEVPAGEYRFAMAGTGENAAASGDLDILDSVQIIGARTGSTTIDAVQLDRVFDIAPTAAAEVQISALRIRGGLRIDGTDADARGAGVRVGPAGRLELFEVIIAENRARLRGGGIDNAGVLHVLRSRIENNQADSAGAGLATGGHPDASAQFVESVLRGNHGADIGGGIAVVRPLAGTSGFQFGTLLVERSALLDNRAITGSAFYADASGQFTLRESTVSGNHATSAATLFIDNFCNTRIENSTITANSAGGGTAGLANMHGPAAPNLRIARSLLAGNQTGACLGVVRSEGHNLVDGLALCQWQAAPGDQLGMSLGLPPRIETPGTTPHHPLPPASPAIDAAGTQCAPLDQLGRPRPLDGDGDGIATCDIGAVEAPDPNAIHADGFEAR